MKLESIHLKRRGRPAVFNGSWYRGESTSFIPCKSDLRDEDAFKEFVLRGWAPPAPFIDRTTPITAFGSCFAAYISDHLAERGYSVFGRHLDLDAHIIRFGEGMVNSFAIRQQLEWALENKDFPADLWIAANKEQAEPDPEIRMQTREIISATQVFVITLGLSEIWYDKPSGEAFWRAIPASRFDPARHGFRVSTVEENRFNIVQSLDLIRAARPDASIVLTLSPVPLMATFRPISCLTANSVSKAILRVALDQVMEEGRERGYYYPAYEMVTAGSFDPFEEDNRHPKPEVVRRVMQTFERSYCIS
jgi:hypothetical protein